MIKLMPAALALSILIAPAMGSELTSGDTDSINSMAALSKQTCAQAIDALAGRVLDEAIGPLNPPASRHDAEFVAESMRAVANKACTDRPQQ